MAVPGGGPFATHVLKELKGSLNFAGNESAYDLLSLSKLNSGYEMLFIIIYEPPFDIG